MIEQIQEALRAEKLDGWLFFDHHRRDPLAYRVLSLPDSLQPSRRWYYFLGAEGEPQKLVHKIESDRLDSLPGAKHTYAGWAEQSKKLETILKGRHRVAMQYSPLCAIPYISLVDGGTVELIRGFGVEVVTSADLVQQFEARLSHQQAQSHFEAGKRVDRIRREAFDLAREKVRNGQTLGEFELQQFILQQFADAELRCDHGPVVAVNANAADPHYEPSRDRSAAVSKGDFLLIDMWAKLDQSDSIYYDITWCGFGGERVPEQIQTVFNVVRDARKASCRLVDQSVRSNTSLAGWQVDDAARGVISDAGFGEYFIHRTGHSIGTEVHGNGANMDNLESHDERRILANTLFSIEPGIYLKDFGVRSEVNVFVSGVGASITGEEQEEIVLI